MKPAYLWILTCFLFLSVFFLLLGFVSFYNTSSSFTAHASQQGTVALFIEGVSSSGTSSSTSSSGGSGGGGGGSQATTHMAPLFQVGPEELNLFIVSREKQESEITLKNLGKNTITISITSSGLLGFASIDQEQITLGPGETKKITLTITAPDSGTYAGRVTFTSGDVMKDVLVLLNTRSANALFDVSLVIPESYKELISGQLVKSFISLLQVGPAAETDVTATYRVKDFEGNTLLTESETFRVLKNKNYIKSFDTSKLSDGDYVLSLEITYIGGFASSSDHFSVKKIKIDFWLVVSVILALIVIFSVYYSIRSYKRANKLLRRAR